MNVLIAFAITFIILLIALIKFKINPGIALFVSAIIMGVLSGISLNEILTHISSGFGGTMASIGIIILFGGVFGTLLGDSGATEEMAKALLRKVGRKNDLLALNLAGFIVAIPVYFASGYIMLSPLINSLQKITKKRMASYSCALFVGLLITHCVVAPTPGPVAVAYQLGANLGWFIVYGLIVSLPASLICGWQYGNVIEKKEEKKLAQEIVNNEEMLAANPEKPSAATAIGLILFPIVLIILGSIASVTLEEGALRILITFIGNNNIALFLAMLVSILKLGKYIDTKGKGVMGYVDIASDKLGSILMVIGTGGCFGAVLKASGLGDELVEVLSSWNLPLIVLAFLLAIIIRAAVGSATVAMLTTASIVAPAINALGESPVAVGLAVCIGTVGLTLPTDAAFWLPARYNDLSTNETFVATTYSTTFASIIGFVIVLILDMFSGSLPGMF